MRPVKLNKKPVEKVQHFKYLGTITDQTLTFNENAEGSDCF